MTITYYNTQYPDGGAPKDQIQSGALNNLFPDLTPDQRQSGLVRKKKLFFETDTAGTLHASATGNYFGAVFKGGSDENEREGDLSGNEARYGALPINSTSYDSGTGKTTITLRKKGGYGAECFRADDTVLVNGSLYTIESVTDGIDTIDIVIDGNEDGATGLAESLLPLGYIDANTKTPLWIEEKVPAGSPPGFGGRSLVELHIVE